MRHIKTPVECLKLMNKPYIDHVIIVEGTSDKNKVLNLFDARVFVTNGYDVDEALLWFIAKYKKIIVLTDSDDAGKQIRNRINNVVECINVEVNLDKCDKHHKHGVAECDKEELISVLKPYISTKPSKDIITNNDLFLLNVNKDKLIKTFGLGDISNKQLVDLINIAGLAKEDLSKYAD